MELPKAFGFTSAVMLGVTAQLVSRSKYSTFLLNSETSEEDFTRFLKSETEKKKIVLVDTLAVYDKFDLGGKLVKRLNKYGVFVLVADFNVVNLSRRFTVVDGKKTGGAWIPLRITTPILECVLDEKPFVEPPPMGTKLDFKESSVNMKLKKSDSGRSKTKDKPTAAVGVKSPTLQGLIIRVTKSIKDSDLKAKFKDTMIAVVLGTKDVTKTEKLRTKILNAGVEDGVYADVLSSIISMKKKLSKAYADMQGGKSVKMVVDSAKVEDTTVFEKNIMYVLKHSPIQ